MELYFAPLACSMASRISFYEADAPVTFRLVDTRAGKVQDGTDFATINPMGQVPALRTDAGDVLTENAVVLLHIADSFPASELAPPDGIDRLRLGQWLSFIATELHKLVFIPLLDRTSNDGAKEFARSKIERRFGRVNEHLAGRDFLLDRFTVADAYLVTVLNWAGFSGVALAPWPALRDYEERMRARPSVARAMAEELAMYRASLAPAAAKVA
jgi:glutathione S-transferase